MSEYQLEPRPALGGYRADIGGIRIEEITGLALVSIAVPLGEDGCKGLARALEQAFGTGLPDPGRLTRAKDGETRFLGMGPDQVFALFPHAGDDADRVLDEKLQGAGYVTLQSDNWLGLRVSGATARAALARICQIDLDPAQFGPDRVARTVMEHMGSIVLRDAGPDSFLLFSAASSARSFLHAVETSARNLG